MCESGVVTHFALKDELLDAQLLRTAGAAPYGGADIGECLATAARVEGTNLTSWHDAWAATAERVRDLAEPELAAGRSEAAREAFFRASNYLRTESLSPPGRQVRLGRSRATAAMWNRGPRRDPA